VIQTVRWVVNEEPLLYRTKTKHTEAVSRHAKSEREQRNELRGLYQELSRHYQRTVGVWTRGELLHKGKHGCIQCTCDDPLTHSPFSIEGFGKSLLSAINSGRVSA
jgi:hypothetical protein